MYKYVKCTSIMYNQTISSGTMRLYKCLGIFVENRLLFRVLKAVTYTGHNVMCRAPLVLENLISRAFLSAEPSHPIPQ